MNFNESMKEEPIINMFGEIVNEEQFAKSQLISSGFFPWLNFTEDTYHALCKKKACSEALTADEESRLIFPLIFGNYNCQINIDKAYEETLNLLDRVKSKKPSENLVKENKFYIDWLHDYAIAHMLLGTIFAYKKEYIKASYHLMRGLKTDCIGVNIPYLDFIRYIVNKLNFMPYEEYISPECGFYRENAMGSIEWGNMLMSDYAMKIIPDMEGENGEVIIAKSSGMGILGYLRRKGSVYGGKFDDEVELRKNETPFEGYLRRRKKMVDMYETYVIDKDYKLSKIILYFNGYFNLGNNKIKLASGFKLKSTSRLDETFEIVQ